MRTTQEFEIKLERLIELLTNGGKADWAKEFIRIKKNIEFDLENSKREIISMYGGMGSLNDVILHNNGVILIAENHEFIRLKSTLFDMCYDLR